MNERESSITKFVCSDCGGGYDEPIAVQNRDGIDHHECPHCGNHMSRRYTEQQNVDNCVHTATVDQRQSEPGYEACTECGLIMGDYSGMNDQHGIRPEWNAAGGRQ